MILSRLVVGVFQENCYIVGCEATKQAMLVDPGDEEARILAEVERLGLKVSLVVNTHTHADHILAVGPIARQTGSGYALGSIEHRFMIERPPRTNQYLEVRELPPVPTSLLEDGDEFEVGEMRFRALLTPGHTPGGMCYYAQDDGVVFTGDTLFRDSIGRFDFDGGDGHRLIQSIRDKLLTLPDETLVLSGHMDQTTIGRERRFNPFLQGWTPE